MKGFFQEFKNFAIKGNMIDMAVGIIIGTAFNKVVSTIVKKVVMPPLSLLTDDVDLASKKLILREASAGVVEVAIGYGELLDVPNILWCHDLAEDPENKEVVTPKNIELLSNIERLMKEQNALMKRKE